MKLAELIEKLEKHIKMVVDQEEDQRKLITMIAEVLKFNENMYRDASARTIELQLEINRMNEDYRKLLVQYRETIRERDLNRGFKKRNEELLLEIDNLNEKKWSLEESLIESFDKHFKIVIEIGTEIAYRGNTLQLMKENTENGFGVGIAYEIDVDAAESAILALDEICDFVFYRVASLLKRNEKTSNL